VYLGPPAAVAAGGAWKVSSKGINYTSDSAVRIPLARGGSFQIEFSPLDNWLPPTNQVFSVVADRVTILHPNYVDFPAVLSFGLAQGLRVTGTTGLVYEIDYTTNLNVPVNWLKLTNITLSANPAVVPGTQITNATGRFFRAVRLPY